MKANDRKEEMEKARKLYESGFSLVDIAKELDVPPGTVRRWKCTQKWVSERSDKKSERSPAKKDRKKEPELETWDEVSDNPALNEKQKLFCSYYVKCFNATKAYQKAYGVSYETAQAAGPRLLGNVRIQNEIKRLKQNRMNRELLTVDDIFQKYIDIAFADTNDYVEYGQEDQPVLTKEGVAEVRDPDTGRMVPLMEKVNYVRFRNSSEVDGTLISEIKSGRNRVSIKLVDRLKALQWLSDHYGMMTEEQKARIEESRVRLKVIKAKADLDNDAELVDDGFLEALKGNAAEDWADEED